MLDEKDLINLDLVVTQGLREQLTMQEDTVLYITRPDQLSASTLMSMEKDYLDGLANDLTEKVGKIVLTESATE